MPDKQRQAEMVERAAAQVYRPSPPLSPASLDFAIAEIAARQNELDSVPPRQMPPRSAPPIAPAAPPMTATRRRPRRQARIFRRSSVISSRSRARSRPCSVPISIEQSIAAFRSELAEIRHAITEAMPRRAIESIENEIRSLSRRIDDTRQSGIDGQALAGIERALGEIREVLRSLTPAEQLAGYDEAIRNLGAKLDLILRANDDPRRSTSSKAPSPRSAPSSPMSPPTMRWRGSAMTCTSLSSKVDQLARSDGHADSFAMLEQRIAALTSSLESREQRPAASENSEHIETALRALSDRLDRMPVGNDNASAFAHLEQRVSYLLERLEASTDQRGGNLGRVEEGLQDILRHLERQHASFAAFAADSRNEPARRTAASPTSSSANCPTSVSARLKPTATPRNSLEAVHNTLGHVVDRLAMIEGDLRAVRVQPAAPQPEAPRNLTCAPQAAYARRRPNLSSRRADAGAPAGRHGAAAKT